MPLSGNPARSLYRIRTSALAALTGLLLISGCAVSPIPEGYTGPTATIVDWAEQKSEKRSFFFVLDAVNGSKVKSSIGETKGANYGQGFMMAPTALAHEVPAQPLKLRLEARVVWAAPVLALGGGNWSVAGEVDFTPEPGKRYAVQGELSDAYSAVWLVETVSQNIVTQKIEKRS